MTKDKKTKFSKFGFTLIEMMVSVSIFVIVAFIVVSTLLTLSFSYKKAQKLRILMDNLGFSVQSISINIREGANYSQPLICGTSCIQFEPVDSLWGLIPEKDVRYFLEGQGIKKCDVPVASTGLCSGPVSILTSPEIKITKFEFTFDTVPSALKRKVVKFLIFGEAGFTDRERSSFFIQDTVSQRSVGS
ncbi:MAG: type II secretion system protein [Candidatus Paceibacterota bacterium]|jgi:prepilin-type N-terminal cleavage/methylation domain-containing protein